MTIVELLAVAQGDTQISMAVNEFKNAVVNNDIERISKIKGLGKKTAERIVLELKDKVGVAAAWEAASADLAPTPEQAHQTDAVLALISLVFMINISEISVKKQKLQFQIPKPIFPTSLAINQHLISTNLLTYFRSSRYACLSIIKYRLHKYLSIFINGG